jgi:uncharacterized Zn finger protein
MTQIDGEREHRPTLRKPRKSLRLRRKVEELRNDWIARAWLDAVSASIGSDASAKGLEYAQLGQVVSIELFAGGINGRVQGVATKPYQITLHIPIVPLNDWMILVEAMASEAFYTARLMDNQLPMELADLFARHGQELIPRRNSGVQVECSCRATGACKHVGAVMYLVAQHLMNEPMAIFMLRGLPAGEVLDRMTHSRTMQTHGTTPAHPAPPLPDDARTGTPLIESIDDYWRSPTEIDRVARFPESSFVPHAILRRLGPSPLGGQFPLMGLLATIYDTISTSRDRGQGDGGS